VINERRLRLIEHQTATFRIDRANTDTNVLTFRVDPTWSGATPHEATLECRDRQLASAR